MPAWLKKTGMQVHFVHPHSLWERGISESIDCVLRLYLPKTPDLSICSQSDVDDEMSINRLTKPSTQIAAGRRMVEVE